MSQLLAGEDSDSAVEASSDAGVPAPEWQFLGKFISRFEIMLARMFGTSGDGVSDRLMSFTKPVTGSFYFAPAVEVLARSVATTEK